MRNSPKTYFYIPYCEVNNLQMQSRNSIATRKFEAFMLIYTI